MEPKKVFGYKDSSTKIIFIFTGLLVLAWLNALPRVWMSDTSLKRYIVVGTLFLGWIFRRMRRITAKLHYLFHPNGDITIVLPNKKKFNLPSDMMISQEKIPNGSRWNGRGIKYLPRKQEVHFTTSNSHLLKISMKDGRVIVISPREYLN